MDPERQPLLDHGPEARLRRIRHLSPREVQTAREDARWRRTRCCLVLIFWAIMAMFLSIVTCILVTVPKCNTYDRALELVPAVPPVHMSFSPLIYSVKEAPTPKINDEVVYSI